MDQLNFPCGVAPVPDRGVFVADTHNHRVLYFAHNVRTGVLVAGSKKCRSGNSTRMLRFPWGVAATPDGGVLIGDAGNNRVVHWRRGASKGSVIHKKIELDIKIRRS